MTLAKISLYYILNTDSDVFCNDVSRALFGSFHCVRFVLLFESMQIHTLSSNLCRFLDWIYCWKELPRDIDFIDDILVHIFFSEKSLLRRLISSNSNEAYDNLRKYNINDIPNKLILLTFSTQQNEFIRNIVYIDSNNISKLYLPFHISYFLWSGCLFRSYDRSGTSNLVFYSDIAVRDNPNVCNWSRCFPRWLLWHTVSM